MERELNFRVLGSSMGWAYADLLGLPYNVGHYYLYVPENRPPGHLPAIVFLHGSYGNFKAYTWVWSKLAEELGFVILAPSFGIGNWRSPGGVESVSRAIQDAGSLIELDDRRIYLAGLSNGGLGISRLAAADRERYRGLIFISPVLATEIVDGPGFQEAWAGRPVLILTGEADERIPLSYVQERVERLQEGGVAVQFIPYPGEDHFLFFSQRELILEDIAKWLGGLSAACFASSHARVWCACSLWCS
jgi:pimeloyl-ACP methyl ester carboxylesterase